jgi:signal transduction histidine kinase
MTESSPSSSPSKPQGANPAPDAFRPRDEREPTLRRLKWTFLVTLILLFIFVEFSRYMLASYLDTLGGRLVMDLVILVGGVFFFGAVFDMVSRMQKQLERQNRELLALHWAALDIYGEASLRTVLQKVVDQARQLLEAKYGAISVYDEKGLVNEFIVSGMSEEQRDRIGAPPEGKGLLGLVLRQGQRLRVPDIGQDPRSAGFPEHHPDMHSLLAVPIVCKGPFRGNLYVTEKKTLPEFSDQDEHTLVRFATSAAIAIDNAHLNQKLRSLAVAEERVRIARELHDGMAQVLAYVNTKAQAVKAYLDKDKPDQASAQLEQLASAARDVYTDAREGIMALRTQVGPDEPFSEALQDYLKRWETQSGITAELEITTDLDISPSIELQLLRIIQEALANARKHSGAKTVQVQLGQEDGFIVAGVEDDGSGFDPSIRSRAAFPRFGLAIMRERAESIGGTLEIDTSPGRGTRVKIRVPTATKVI